MQMEIWGSLGNISGEECTYCRSSTTNCDPRKFLKTESPTGGNYPKGERVRRKLGYVCGAAIYDLLYEVGMATKSRTLD